MDIKAYVNDDKIDHIITVKDIKKTAYIPINREYMTDTIVT